MKPTIIEAVTPLLAYRQSLLDRLPTEPENTLLLNEQITMAGVKIANQLQAAYKLQHQTEKDHGKN